MNFDQYNQIRHKIKGPIFSVITPFKKNGDVDYIVLKKYLFHLYNRGARVFYIMFYNSRLGLLSKKEVIDLHKFISNIVKKKFKNCILIGATPYHSNYNEILSYLKLFKKIDIDLASLIFGEKYYSDDQIYNYFKKISNKSKIGLLLHQQPIENGIKSNPNTIKYSIKLLRKISLLKNFIALKEDTKINNYTKKIIKNTKKNFNIITSGGGKKQWMLFSRDGCPAWLSGISCIDPKVGIIFYKLYNQKKYKECKKLIKFIEDPFFKTKDKYGWHLTIKGSLEILNLMKRYERLPMAELNSIQMKDIRKMVKLLISNSNKYFKNYDFFNFNN